MPRSLQSSNSRMGMLPARRSVSATTTSSMSRLNAVSVSDIVALPEDALQPPPSTGKDDVMPFLHGLAALDERMVMVLDLYRLGADEDLADAA